MKKRTIFFIALLIMTLSTSIVLAKSSEEFIEYLTSIVYEDCKGVRYEGEPITRDFIKQEIVKIDDQLPAGITIRERPSSPQELRNAAQIYEEVETLLKEKFGKPVYSHHGRTAYQSKIEEAVST